MKPFGVCGLARAASGAATLSGRCGMRESHSEYLLGSYTGVELSDAVRPVRDISDSEWSDVVSGTYPITDASHRHELLHARSSIVPLHPPQRASSRVRPFGSHDRGRIDAAEVSRPPPPRFVGSAQRPAIDAEDRP
jgi:hypothetical protein